ncbi:hypothetical protein, partial [Klebsiella michiganensis]|uniref:hypothetical protein n=1 Tax=Klebsiella michiganensis TaxID=1134687 RepID=UPI001955259A
ILFSLFVGVIVLPTHRHPGADYRSVRGGALMRPFSRRRVAVPARAALSRATGSQPSAIP